MRFFSVLLGLLALAQVSFSQEVRTVKVFVALCDNATQGILKVGAKIGNGDQPDDNLYWGCDDGLRSFFKASAQWKLVSKKRPTEGPMLEICEFKSTQPCLLLTAYAYRGAEMKQCLLDFEQAIRGGGADFMAYIGHNALMDFQLPIVRAQPSKKPCVAVLCCKSQSYFTERIVQQGGRPVLLTSQLMYPGAFILHDALAVWRKDGPPAALREAAAKAYAKNQHISVSAARGVFAEVK